MRQNCVSFVKKKEEKKAITTTTTASTELSLCVTKCNTTPEDQVLRTRNGVLAQDGGEAAERLEMGALESAQVRETVGFEPKPFVTVYRPSLRLLW